MNKCLHFSPTQCSNVAARLAHFVRISLRRAKLVIDPHRLTWCPLPGGRGHFQGHAWGRAKVNSAASQTEVGRWVLWTDEAEPRELVRLADVIRSRAGAKTSLREAAGQVALKVFAEAKGTELFLIREFDAPLVVDANVCWLVPDSLAGREWRYSTSSSRFTADQVPDDFRGVQGAFACMVDSGSKQQLELDAGLAGQLAILVGDAEKLFGAIRMVEDARVVQPEGGKWPRTKTRGWTNPEKSAMSKMRGAGMSDKEIAGTVDPTGATSRQAVGSALGGSSVAVKAMNSTVVQLGKQRGAR
jgi:hypothetical protein